jgi:DNA processing protein
LRIFAPPLRLCGENFPKGVVVGSDAHDSAAWIALSRAELPAHTARELVEHFQGAAAIFTASPVEIAEAAKLTPAMLGRLLAQRPDETASRDIAKLAEIGAHIITLCDTAYPPLLRQIPDPPCLLYVQGELCQTDQTIAIVGSRRCSPYGRLVAQTLARELAARGVTIVSGLAPGIDAAAHLGALEAGGRTIGVMACGLEVDYPREHKELKQRMAAQGAVITEVPLGTPPTPARFPMRNRIISGLSRGVVVVEAPEQSGALITAHLAADQGREVFAVPGSVNSFHSRGCHQLIREGAKLIDGVDDILEEFAQVAPIAKKVEKAKREKAVAGASSRPTKPVSPPSPTLPVSSQSPNEAENQRQAVALAWPSGLTDEEGKLLSCLSLQQKYVDEIIHETSLPTASVSSGLMMLELKGLIKRLPGNLFVRVK